MLGVFADQKWRNAASKIDVPVDEEDNSDVQWLTEWTLLNFKFYCFDVDPNDLAVFLKTVD